MGRWARQVKIEREKASMTLARSLMVLAASGVLLAGCSTTSKSAQGDAESDAQIAALQKPAAGDELKASAPAAPEAAAPAAAKKAKPAAKRVAKKPVKAEAVEPSAQAPEVVQAAVVPTSKPFKAQLWVRILAVLLFAGVAAVVLKYSVRRSK